MSKNVLIAYFSASGVTARVAREMAEAVDADVYEIRPAQPYSAADLDWTDKQSRSTLEMKDPASRPPLAEPVPDVSGYDAVFVGFPIWWGVEPRAVDTFLDACGLRGGKAIPFATSGGSGIGAAEKHLRAVCPEADWQPGRLVNRGGAAWAKSVLGM